MNDVLTGRRLTFWTTLQLLCHLPTLLQLLSRLIEQRYTFPGGRHRGSVVALPIPG